MLLLNEIRHLDPARHNLAEAQAAFLASGGRVDEIESGRSALETTSRFSLHSGGARQLNSQEAKLAERIIALAAKGRHAAEICKIMGLPAATFDHIVAKRRIFIKPRRAGARA